MSVSDVANSTFLSLLNSGKGWKIERLYVENRVVFKCPTCVSQYGGGSSVSYYGNGSIVPCHCAIKHEKSAWVSEQIQRALLVRKKGIVPTTPTGGSLVLRK
jgi:predicted metal-binding protein